MLEISCRRRSLSSVCFPHGRAGAGAGWSERGPLSLAFSSFFVWSSFYLMNCWRRDGVDCSLGSNCVYKLEEARRAQCVHTRVPHQPGAVSFPASGGRPGSSETGSQTGSDQWES